MPAVPEPVAPPAPPPLIFQLPRKRGRPPKKPEAIAAAMAASGGDAPEYVHAKNGQNLAENAPLAASLISDDNSVFSKFVISLTMTIQ